MSGGHEKLVKTIFPCLYFQHRNSYAGSTYSRG